MRCHGCLCGAWTLGLKGPVLPGLSFEYLISSGMSDLFQWPKPETTVVNLKEEGYDVRIDRKTKWGNPYVVGRDGTREECIDKYSEWIEDQEHLMSSLHELKGKRLGCWCHPQACHGDVLARLANQLKG